MTKAENSESLFKIAYDAHYKERNYRKALENYQQIIDKFPNSDEARYSHAQIAILENSKDNLEKQRVKRDVFPPINDPPVILTTAPWLEGYRVIETIEVITSECVLGIDFISDFFAKITDAFGGRSGMTQNYLKSAQKTCLSELKQEADRLGANAVIAVSLNYSEFSGQGKSMVFLVASGTAVMVEKIDAIS